MTVQSSNPVTSHTAMTNQAASSSTPATSSNTSSPTSTPSIDGLATENTFLQLLVAQIKNQDPLQPADSIQFLSQLAQFSQLEQLIGIRQDLHKSGSSTDATDQNGGTTATTGSTN